MQDLELRGMFVFTYIVDYKVLDEEKEVILISILPARFGMDYIASKVDGDN